MSKCGCGKDLTLPALFVGMTPQRVPIALYHCQCGKAAYEGIETMVPYVADKCETFPPLRGEYFVATDGSVTFTCPVCKKPHGIAAPVHTINAEGTIHPSMVCPYGCGFHVWMTLKDWVAP